MSDFLVLGAGMVGISTALELQARGHAVVVIDRKPPGRETSHGNAGLIQAEAAEPYAMPRALPELARIALGRSNDVIWSPRGVWGQMPALWQYFRASHPRRHRALSRPHAHLIASATRDHQRWITAAGAEDLIARDGYLSVLRDARRFDAMTRELARLRDTYGMAARALDGAALRAEEPLFTATPAGGIHFPSVWSCRDPGALVTRYAALFAAQGGRIVTGDAMALRPDGAGWSLDTGGEALRAERAVIALGPWSPALLARLGYRLRMIMKHGAHRMFPKAPRLRRPIHDEAHGIVLSSMAGGLRMTSGVALESAGREPPTRQLDRGAAGLRAWLDLGPDQAGATWRGTRPFLPDMLPMLGPAPRHRRLWFHFGHGHQGFTLGPSSARHLADMIEGATDPALAPLRPEARPAILR